MSLKQYTRKRDFKATSEPQARAGTLRGERIFVVQLHHASRRHFDFRLALDDVLKSWAIPKGPSFDPHVKRLAVEVEDHPISYAGFSGDIAKGNYGAGHVAIFDQGTWTPIGSARQGLRDGNLKFILHGDVLRGEWVLVRTRMQGSKQQWLLIKHQDEYAGMLDIDSVIDQKADLPISAAKRKKIWTQHSAKALVNEIKTTSQQLKKIDGAKPEKLHNGAFAPQLCKSQASPPRGDDWLHEVKWDGYRMLTCVVKGAVKIWSRNAIEWTHKLPELVAAIKSLKLDYALLDGEIIVLGGGKSDFNALQGRLSDQNNEPVLYMLFDMPHLHGVSLRDVALEKRKAVLHAVLQAHPNPLLRYSHHQIGNGTQVFAQAVAAGLEGIVSKRLQSGYAANRNGDWVKAKARSSDEFVVIGYTQPKGSRTHIGALLLARSVNAQLRFAGRVGTGLADHQLSQLRKRLDAIIIDKPALDVEKIPRADRACAIWVKPELIVEVYFQSLGANGMLRHAAFKTVRSPSQETKSGIAERKKQFVEKSAQGSKVKKQRELTHANREVFAKIGITKGDVAEYYRAVSPWLLPEIQDRPLAIVRCPDGADKECFFQKQVGAGWGNNIRSGSEKKSGKYTRYLYVEDQEGLLDLVQMNALELHPWGSKVADIERADRIVFDLDPHADVIWRRVTAAARQLRTQLESIGLTCFLRTSGGKGLHVVVPLNPTVRWATVKAFAHAVAQALVEIKPKEFVSVAGEKNRRGKIFVDWLRNGRGSTSVASYSVRARASAGVAMPIAWEQLSRVKSGDAYTIKNTKQAISRRKKDPWSEIEKLKQTLP